MAEHQDKEPIEADQVQPKKKCFVIMPIADQPGYPDGHFTRVYKEIIIPAVKQAGFDPVRADTASQSHLIMLDILRSIVEHDMAICDISALNPNVLYELGIRQMSQKPVILIKDKETRRIFDISGISDFEYDSSLRVDTVRNAINNISNAILTTYENKEEKVASLVGLLNITLVVEKKEVEVSEGQKIIIDKMNSLEKMISNFQTSQTFNINKSLILDDRTSEPGLIGRFFRMADGNFNERAESYFLCIREIDNGWISAIRGVDLKMTTMPASYIHVVDPREVKIQRAQQYANLIGEATNLGFPYYE